MAAWSQPTHDAHADVMDLGKLVIYLHRNQTVTPAMVEAIEHYATVLSRDIHDDYNVLNSIMVRHEELIRLRWMSKTIAQRRKILLAAWPNMAEEHRPDINGVTLEKRIAQGLVSRDSTLPDIFVWPFINQEDLSKPKTLLVYLSSRGRKKPWEFAAIETEFSPMLTMIACADDEFCGSVTMDFTETLDPSAYGKVNRHKHHPYRQREIDKCDICARRGFQVLLVQQRILAFLLACAKAILHDLDEGFLLHGPEQAAPPVAQIMDHTSFTDVLSVAPYRGWDSLNFTQLRGYVQSTLTTHKEHVWALREDPGYFVDTVQECLDHSLYTIPLCCSNGPHVFAGMPQHKSWILRDMVDESYAMVNGWADLKERLDAFDRLLEKGSTKQQQAQVILQFEQVAKRIGVLLLERVFRCSRAAPKFRLLLRRKCATQVWEHKYEYVGWVTSEENKVLEVFKGFRLKEKASILDWPMFLALQLESVARMIQTSDTARKMVTGLVLSLLTDLSIVVEYLRQASLWGQSPDVKTGQVDACGCKVPLVDGIVDFNEWLSALDDSFSPPLDLVFPLKDKLNYPEHKKRARDTIAIMRKSEQSLDQFWSAIDAHFQAKTGMAQHRVIRDILERDASMHRTAPWGDGQNTQARPSKLSDQEYFPIPVALHDKASQVTGAFDKMAIVDRFKSKTKDLAVTTVETMFKVDKRTYKVFRTLLSASFDGVGEVSKSAKWAEFKRAMVRVGFSAEKLQVSAWQFTPDIGCETDRSIQFHEPHPSDEISYVIAKRIGRRLRRVYGWHGDIFQLV